MIDAIKAVGHEIARPVGQLVTSVVTTWWGWMTFQTLHDVLSIVGMIAGISVSVTLVTLNLINIKKARGV